MDLEIKIQKIFKSKIRKRIFKFFIDHPQEKLYLRELERRLSLPIGNLRRNLTDLEKNGVISSEKEGRHIYFKLEARSDISARFLREKTSKKKNPDSLPPSPANYMESLDLPFLRVLSKKYSAVLARTIANKRWIPFLGSGISRRSGIPIGSQLVEEINKELKKDFPLTELPEASQAYEERFTRAGLISFLNNQISSLGLEPNQIHSCIVDLGPKEIITTNVDDFIEKSLQHSGISDYSVSLWNEDTKERKRISIFKPHGDIKDSESLIFTSQDYNNYRNDPRKKLIWESIKGHFISQSFVFLGYSLSDKNFIEIFEEVANLQTPKSEPATNEPRHFLVTDEVSDSDKEKLLKQGVCAIEIGSHSNLFSFMQALSKAVDALEGGNIKFSVASGIIDKVTSADEEQYKKIYDLGFVPVVEAIRAHKFKTAENYLIAWLDKLSGLSESSLKKEFARDLKQRILLNMANVAIHKGNLTKARELIDDATKSGPMSDLRRVHAAEILVNLGHFRNARILLESPEGLIIERGKQIHALAQLLEVRSQTKIEEVDLATCMDIDLLLGAIRLRLEGAIGNDARLLSLGIDRAWEMTEKAPFAMQAVAGLQFDLFQKILSEELRVWRFDRKRELQKLEERISQAFAHSIKLKDEIPEEAASACSLAISFYGFLDDVPQVVIYREHLKELEVTPSPRHFLSGIHENAPTISQVEDMYGQGRLSLFEKNILLGKIFSIDEKSQEGAQGAFLAALKIAKNEPEKNVATELLVKSFLNSKDVPGAASIINGLSETTSIFTRELKALLFIHEKKWAEAIQLLQDVEKTNPRSFFNLANLGQVLMHAYQESGDGSNIETRKKLLLTADRTARKLYALLPSARFQLDRAKILFQLGHLSSSIIHFQGALRLLELLAKNGADIKIKRLLIDTLNSLKMHERAATEISQEPRFDSYRDKYSEGQFWGLAGKYPKAISIWEGLLSHPEATPELYHNLCIAYMSSGDSASYKRALTIAKEGFFRFPSFKTFPGLLIQAGEGSGDSKEAWDIVGKLDLTNNPTLQMIPEEEGIKMFKEALHRDNLRRQLYLSSMIPFSIYAANSSRQPIFLWQGRVLNWKKGASRFPFFISFLRPFSFRTPESVETIILDHTSLLLLLSLGVEQEIFLALKKAGIKVLLMQGVLGWLDKQIASLQVNQMPGYYGKRRQLKDLLERSRDQVDIQPTLPNSETKLNSALAEKIGWFATDIELALQRGAIYLDDFIPADISSQLTDVPRTTSANLLKHLVKTGVIDTLTAENVKSSFPEPFSRTAEGPDVNFDLLVVDDQSLLLWFESGLLARWLSGEAGWPKKIIVGPSSWNSLNSQIFESDVHLDALSVAIRARKTIGMALAEHTVQELVDFSIPPPPENNLPSMADIYSNEIGFLKNAKPTNSAIWTEDLAFKLLIDMRGPLVVNKELGDLSKEIKVTYEDAPLWGVNEILGLLQKKGAISSDRHMELIQDMLASGYRCINLDGFLFWQLKRYGFNMTGVRFNESLAMLKELRLQCPPGVDANRYKNAFLDMYLAPTYAQFLAQVWLSEDPGISSDGKRTITKRILSELNLSFGIEESPARKIFWHSMLSKMWLEAKKERASVLRDFLNHVGAEPDISEETRKYVAQVCEENIIEALKSLKKHGDHVRETLILLRNFLAQVIQTPIMKYASPAFHAFMGPALELPLQGNLAIGYSLSEGGSGTLEVDIDDINTESARMLTEVFSGSRPPMLRELTPLSITSVVTRPVADTEIKFFHKTSLMLLLPKLSGRDQERLIEHLSDTYSKFDIPIANRIKEVDLSKSSPFASVYREYLTSLSFQFSTGIRKGFEAIANMTWEDLKSWVGTDYLWPKNGVEGYGVDLNKSGAITDGHRSIFEVLTIVSQLCSLAPEAALRQYERAENKDRLITFLVGELKSLDTFHALRALSGLIAISEKYDTLNIPRKDGPTPLRNEVVRMLSDFLRTYRSFSGISSGDLPKEATEIEVSKIQLHASIMRLSQTATISNRHMDELTKHVKDGDKDVLIGTMLFYTLIVVHRVTALIELQYSRDNSLFSKLQDAENSLHAKDRDLNDFFLPSLYGDDTNAYNYFVAGVLGSLWFGFCPPQDNSLAFKRPFWATDEILGLLKSIQGTKENSSEIKIKEWAKQEASDPASLKKNRLRLLFDTTPQEYAAAILERLRNIQV